jgi:uncharacterized protein (UPF0371 family)
MYRTGFDNEKYLMEQTQRIVECVRRHENKLYLEFGGKLFDDFHAARVLPGFVYDNKIKLLSALADRTEIILVINADDIGENRIQGDYGITYGDELFRLLRGFRRNDLYVSSVVITRFADQPSAKLLRQRLEAQDVRVYTHYTIEGYPTNVPLILSDEGFGKNDFIETTRPLVVVTAPGSCSGKMAACLSQLYHEFERGVKAGYAKYESFPIWDLPLNHPVNLAYEAATINVNDVNMIDPFHLEAYGVRATNYNRDVAGFPVVNAIFTQIYGESPYKSPTEMGVNMLGNCISDDEVCRNAAKQEIVRRYYKEQMTLKQMGGDKADLEKLEILMNKAETGIEDRPVVAAALAKEAESTTPSFAIELPTGDIITGRTTEMLGAASSCLLNALKHLAGVDDSVKLLSREIIEPINRLKTNFLGNHNPRLHTDEVLIALSICSATDAQANLVFSQLHQLSNSEAHSSVILSSVDIGIFRKLGVNLTCEAKYG